MGVGGSVGGNGCREWSVGARSVGPRIHGVWSLQCVLHEAGGEWNSEAQPETAAAARGRRREYSVVLPSVASGLFPCIMAISPRDCLLQDDHRIMPTRRRCSSTTKSGCFDSGPATPNKLLLHQNNWNIAFLYHTVPSTLLARTSRLGEP